MTDEKQVPEDTQVIPADDDLKEQLEEADRLNREHSAPEADRAPQPGNTPAPEELPQRD
jgi:hypothetical protein